MSVPQPYSQPLLPAARASRALARLGSDTTLGVATIQARAELQAARVTAIAGVAASALQDIALFSQVEQALATAVPHASGRMATVADVAAVAAAGVVADTARRIG